MVVEEIRKILKVISSYIRLSLIYVSDDEIKLFDLLKLFWGYRLKLNLFYSCL